MPQNAIIRADGTGDYTTLAAWEAGEQNSDYGSITVGRVDGFFDQGGNQFIIGGAWTNGARLEAFDSTIAFNGVERQLCGMTGSNTFATLRTTIAVWELDGLEVYNTSTGGSHRQTTITATNVVVNDVLSKTVNGASSLDVPANVSTVTNTVLVGNQGFNNAINGTNVTLFANTASSVGGSGASSLTNSVIANASTGACYRSSVTQSNNAATDTTADAFDNIIVADNFVNPDPVTGGDYRIESGSLLANNNIGAFIEIAGGITITPQTAFINAVTLNPTITLSAPIELTESTVIATVSSNSPSITLTPSISITESTSTIPSISNNPTVSLTPSLAVIESQSNILTQSLNPTIETTGTLDISESTVNIETKSPNPSIKISIDTGEQVFTGVEYIIGPFEGYQNKQLFKGKLIYQSFKGAGSDYSVKGEKLELSFKGDKLEETTIKGTEKTFTVLGVKK